MTCLSTKNRDTVTICLSRFKKTVTNSSHNPWHNLFKTHTKCDVLNDLQDRDTCHFLFGTKSGFPAPPPRPLGRGVGWSGRVVTFGEFNDRTKRLKILRSQMS